MTVALDPVDRALARRALASENADAAPATRRRPRLLLNGLRPSTSGMDHRSLSALAALLLLVQLPHVVHLPIWISGVGAALVGLRLLAARHPDRRWLDTLLSSTVLTLLAVALAVAIRAHYGYLVGRDPAVAFLFLLVAAKFAELRRGSDATVLLCLASFLLLTQYFYSQTLIAAVITLPAVIALGHALAVLRDPAAAVPIAVSARRVGGMLVQGAPLAILLFVVFPRLSGPLWSLPEDSMATTGLSDSMSPGSIGALSLSDAVAFRVEFDGAPPPPSERYWRGPVLDRFDGRAWTASPLRLRAEPGAAPGPTVDYTVLLQPHRQRWLFALDLPTSLPRSSTVPDGSPPLATLLHDGQLIANRPVSQVLRYRQSSSLSDRLVTSREPDDATLALAGRNPRAARLAAELKAAHPTPADYARAVLARFAEAPFAYTLSPQLLGDAPVDEFLFDTREGFCEHYASAFTVLMRAAGIPARVVTGYQGGEMNGDYMIVRQSDAHAWAEAWHDGAWHRYDPTGAIAPSRVEAGIAAALPDSRDLPTLARDGTGWLRAAALRWDRVNHHWQRLVVDFDNDSQAGFWRRLGLDTPALWQLTAGVIVAAALWSTLVLGWRPTPPIGWTRRRLPAAERAWLALETLLARHDLERRSGETGSAWLARAARERPSLADSLARLDAAFAQARFGKAAPPGTDELPGAVAALRKRLRARPTVAARTPDR